MGQLAYYFPVKIPLQVRLVNNNRLAACQCCLIFIIGFFLIFQFLYYKNYIDNLTPRMNVVLFGHLVDDTEAISRYADEQANYVCDPAQN